VSIISSEEQLALLRQKLESAEPATGLGSPIAATDEQLAALREKLGATAGKGAENSASEPAAIADNQPECLDTADFSALISVADAAEKYDIKPNTIHKWIQRGKVKSHGRDNDGHVLVDSRALVGLLSHKSAPGEGDRVARTRSGKGYVVPDTCFTYDSGELISAAAAAKRYGLSASTIRGWASRGYKDRYGRTVNLLPIARDHRRRTLYHVEAIEQAMLDTSRRAGRRGRSTMWELYEKGAIDRADSRVHPRKRLRP
jgi:transposase-like protein